MWILCTVADDFAGKKRWVAVTRADALNRSFTVLFPSYPSLNFNTFDFLNFLNVLFLFSKTFSNLSFY